MATAVQDHGPDDAADTMELGGTVETAPSTYLDQVLDKITGVEEEVPLHSKVEQVTTEVKAVSNRVQEVENKVDSLVKESPPSPTPLDKPDMAVSVDASFGQSTSKKSKKTLMDEMAEFL